MSKRLTDTEKWNDAWFIELNRDEKLFFSYLIDNVDNAGFFELSFRKIKFDLEFSESEILGAIKGLTRGLIFFNEGLKNGDVIYLKNFLRHQKNYPLNPFNSFHNHALKIFEDKLNLVKKSDFLSNIEVCGINRKTEEKVSEKLVSYIQKKQGLESPLVKVNVEVEVKEEVKVKKRDFEKSKITPEKVVSLYHQFCATLPSVEVINKPRISSINARLKEHGLNKITQVFKQAGASNFLRGENKENWNATFDWLMKPTNFVKVLEGNYKNKNGNNVQNFVSNR